MSTQSRKPNILLIMTDQQRSDSLGCYGASWLSTPRLDGLAREGILFENCYANNPVCTPSRASLLTGRQLPGHGVYRLHDILPSNQVLFPQWLRQTAYRTGLFGKLHVSGRLFEAGRRVPNDGFDAYEWCLEAALHLDSPYNGYAAWLRSRYPEFFARLSSEGRTLLHIPRECHFTHWAAERTIEFIRNREKERPFFAMMSVFDPHNPYEDYPDEYAGRVDAAAMPDPIREMDAAGSPVPTAVLREREHSYLGGFSSFSAEDVMRMRFGYYASIALIDDEVGNVLTALEEEGIADETLVIFTSDHGDMLGDHDLLVKGGFFYDPCTKVPLIMRWPGVFSAGTRTAELVQLHDVAATALSAAGLDPGIIRTEMPESLNLLTFGTAGAARGHDAAFCLYRNSGIADTGTYWDPPIDATMVRDARFKLNLYVSREGGAPLQGQLFDMERDPLELRNLWQEHDYREVRDRLIARLVEFDLQQETLCLGSRGGEIRPDSSQRLVNKLKRTMTMADRMKEKHGGKKDASGKKLRGVIPALLTPFREDGSVDEELLEKQADYLVSAGVNGLFIGGTTAEGAYLSTAEKQRIFARVKRSVPRETILAAVSLKPSTGDVIEELRELLELEPDYVSAVTPFYYPAAQEVVIDHYRRIAEASPVPVIVYNIPQNTHNPVALETLLALAEVDNIAGVKDSSGNFVAFSRGLLAGKTPDFAWIQGEDLLDAPSFLLGAPGIVTGLGNVRVEPYVEMFAGVRDGDPDRVKAAQRKINALAEIIFATGGKVIPAIKAGAAVFGRSSVRMRIASMTLSDGEIRGVKDILESLDF